MTIFESILDNIESDERSTSKEIAVQSNVSGLWKPWGSDISGSDYNLKIVVYMIFNYNLNN